MRRVAAAVFLLCGVAAASLRAQSVAVDADVTVGASNAPTNAAAAEFRVVSDLPASWRLFADATWGTVTNDVSDAFGAAYEYDDRVRPDEAYVEKISRPAGNLFSVRLGRYRTPFGISSPSDYAYTGFTRAPLIRYGGSFALSNSFLEAGADVVVGKPFLQLETSVGTPLDQGEDPRRAAPDIVTRVQGFYRSLIVGVSYLNSTASDMGPFVTGRMMFGGVDARWMMGGVELRGEWISGRPFSNVTTRGGYTDLTVHRRFMGPVTAVARIERIDYDAGEFSSYYRRATAGARVRFTRTLSVQTDILREFGPTRRPRRVAIDASLTESLRF